MFELSSHTKVAELQAHSKAMMKALMATGIFREGDDPDITIDELCLGYGLHPLMILRTLAQVQEEVVPVGVDVSELEGMTLTQIVEHIEKKHHKYLRETLPVIAELIRLVVGVHGKDDERLGEVQELFGKVAEDLEKHLLHEEEALFPMCRDMEIEGKINPTRCGDAVGGPIACMENDHAEMKEHLGQLGELTDNFTAPGHACTTYRAMIRLLVQFNQDMAEHIYKEDKVLFPGAVEAQAALKNAG